MSQQLQTVDRKRTIQSFFEGRKAAQEMAKVLPKFITPERMLRVFWTATLRNPKLLDCSQESLWESMMTLSELGLEPDGRNAHLIPYGTKCTPLVDYRGYIARAQANGLRGIHFDVAHMNDIFEWYEDGEGLHFKHAPDMRKPDRGQLFAAYCVWKEKDDDMLHGVIVSRAEIDDIRNSSPGANSPAWVKRYSEMCKKTAVRRAKKQWPIDVKLAALEASGKVSVATVDVESTVDSEPVEAAESQSQIEQPTATAPTAAAPKISEGDAARTTILEAEVPLEMLVAEVTARNIALGADQWKSYDDVPAGVFESLAASPKALGTFVKKFGKKS